MKEQAKPCNSDIALDANVKVGENGGALSGKQQVQISLGSRREGLLDEVQGKEVQGK